MADQSWQAGDRGWCVGVDEDEVCGFVVVGLEEGGDLTVVFADEDGDHVTIARNEAYPTRLGARIALAERQVRDAVHETKRRDNAQWLAAETLREAKRQASLARAKVLLAQRRVETTRAQAESGEEVTRG